MISISLILFLLLTPLGNTESSTVKPCQNYPCNECNDDVSGSRNDEEKLPCCSSGNYTFCSMVDALNNATSNTIIKISTDVVLSSTVLLVGLNNVTIIGQGNPNVTYIEFGSVKFVSCSNINIEGIIWKGSDSVPGSYYSYKYKYITDIESGDYENSDNLSPGIDVQHSSNITIQNCSFHHAVSQAVLLSNVSGIVYINNCQFTHNRFRNGHGAALYYETIPEQSAHVQLTINNCNFISNGPSRSVVCIYNSLTNSRSNRHSSLLQSSTFTKNQGVPIYILHTTLILNNSVSFRSNSASNGGGVYSTNSTIIFDFKCNVNFITNFVYSSGGAIYLTDSKMIFRINAAVMFTRNAKAKANIIDWDDRIGGAVYCYQSLISFEDWSITKFVGNKGGLGGAVYASHSTISASERSRVTFTRNNVRYEGAGIYASNSHITFHGSSTVTFNNNHVGLYKGGGAAVFARSSSITFHGNSTVTFSSNEARDGAAVYAWLSDIYINGSSKVTFNNNKATRYGGAVYAAYSKITFHDSSIATFNNNSHTTLQGGAVFSEHSTIVFQGISTFKNNHATHSGGAMFAVESSIAFNGNSMVTFSNNTATQGGAVHIFHTSYFVIQSDQTFSRSGGGWKRHVVKWSSDSTSISFNDNSTVSFVQNTAKSKGGALVIHSDTPISIGIANAIFSGNSTVTFSNNTAEQGGALCFEGDTHFGIFQRINPDGVFQGNTNVTFINNEAREGGAIYMSPLSFIMLTGIATVTFFGNTASVGGGAILSFSNSDVWLTGKCTMYFNNNWAGQFGGAIHLIKAGHIKFAENSTAKFCNNTASLSGGALSSLDNSFIWFTGGSTVLFNNNLAKQNGGGIWSATNTRITFNESCSVLFRNNTALQQGGAVYLLHNTTTMFRDNCNVTYTKNTALQQGGAIYSALQSVTHFKGSSFVTFMYNKAIVSGGALYSFSKNHIQFDETCKISFHHNMVRKDGGAVQAINTTIYFIGNSSVTFTSNAAMQQGGALSLFYKSVTIFQDDSNVTFTFNTAMQHGGAVYVHDNSSINFVGSAKVIFHNNMVERDGGAICTYSHCNITIGQYSKVIFVKNSAMQCGGAMCCDRNSDATIEGQVTFTRNYAAQGGAVCGLKSFMKFANSSVVVLSNNRATWDGGAIHFSDHCIVTYGHDSSVSFSYNIANRYGGALYSKVNHEGLSKLTLSSTRITFTDNSALTGDSIYLDIPTSCNETCLNRSIVGVNKETLKHGPLAKHIHTPPSMLVLYDPAVCTDKDNTTTCGTYSVNNIMLGQEIFIDACVLDYYDQPAGETRFMVDDNDDDHYINGSNSVLISCDGLQGISVTGSKILDMTNFEINFTSYTGSQSNLKTISIELITELSPCHPGFYYDDTTERCVCYHDTDVITCSDSTSFIKRDYWFGVVGDKSTVTVCPTSFCNFTCCEVTGGFYELSPVRMNQCSSHRSGTACGSCEEGYTLSFDSMECISINKCSAEQTVLVVTLSVIYWIAVVILVFVMTYYHVGIGYLYAITYYYSMLDILLGQPLYQSKRFFAAVNTISSVVKITPQFLGRFCLAQNMSGIDQQFIHYSHPLAVSVIIVIICQAAKISHRFSSFISRGIIRTVCFLLLLSYTSVATTSLLVLRSLTFDNVDKVYTYLSPDIEYCHGRHLPYFITAMFCALVIVIGLPLLLLLEPFLNHKINFTRIKPLLDQFQGCYKDNYRCFAAYYMICRLVIIMIIISIPSINDISQFLLIISSVILAVIILVLRPYEHQILNIFDGLILQVLVFATVIPLATNTWQQISIAISISLPLILFIALELIVYKETIKNIAAKISARFKAKPVPVSNDSNEVPMGGIGLVIDDSMRVNATICVISDGYRDSFLEVMDEIEDN